ncbi:MAG: response regulator [Anaerolineales bacterium]
MRTKASILLVEDDEVDVMGVKRSFAHNKIANPLFVASDGEQALAFLRHEGEYADPEKHPRPCIILLDLKLPRMGGIDFLRVIKNDPDILEIPVVVFTASDEETDVKESFRNGVAGYIVKPVTFEKFVEAIATFDLYWTLSELP